MKKLLSLSLLAGLMFGVASCEPDVPEETNQTKITLSATEAAVPGGGGEVVVIYSVINPQEGAELSITTEADWITIDTSKARQAILTCKYNNGDARQAKVIFAYPGIDNVEFTVTQEAYIVPISLTVHSVEATKVFFSVDTADPELTWIGQIVGREWYDELGGDEDAIFDADYEYYVAVAKDEGLTLEEYLTQVLNHGPAQNLVYNGLDPESEYVIYVYGLDASGERTTFLCTEPITTATPWDGPLTFKLGATVEGHIIHASCEVSHEGSNYWFDIVPASYITGEVSAEAIKTYAQGQIEWKIQDWKDHDYIYDDSEFFEFFNHTMNIGNYTMEGTANSTYYVYACKWGKDCQLVGDLVYHEVVTEDVLPSDNEFTLTIDNVTATTCEFTLETTNDDQYIIAPIPAWYFDDMEGTTDADYFDVIYHEWAGCSDENDFNIIYYTDYGSIYGTFTALDPETKHVLCVFGYTAGVMTTDMTRIEFTTLPAGDPADCTFTIEVPEEDIKIREIHAIITPSDDSVKYFFDVFAADATTADVIAHIDNIKSSLYDPMEFNRFVSYLEEDVDISGLTPSTDYKIGVIPMVEGYIFDSYGDMIGRGYVVAEGCEATFSEVFTTKEAKYADIDIKVILALGGYYDGKILADAAPNTYGAWYEYAYVPLAAEVKGTYDYYRYSMLQYEEGLEDPAVFSDDVIINTLETIGVNYSPAYFRGTWDEPVMLCAVAVDNDGNYSPVWREVVTYTHEGVSPASDIIGSDSSEAPAFNWAQSLIVPKVTPAVKSDNNANSDVKVFGGLDVNLKLAKARAEARRAEEVAIKSQIAEKRAALAEQKAAKSATTKRYTMEKEW